MFFLNSALYFQQFYLEISNLSKLWSTQITLNLNLKRFNKLNNKNFSLPPKKKFNSHFINYII